MATTAEFAPTNEKTRRAPFLPCFLLTMVVLGTLSALTLPAFFAPEREPGHRSPRACIDRGGEMQAVSTGPFGSGSRAVCLFPDGTTSRLFRMSSLWKLDQKQSEDEMMYCSDKDRARMAVENETRIVGVINAFLVL